VERLLERDRSSCLGGYRSWYVEISEIIGHLPLLQLHFWLFMIYVGFGLRVLLVIDNWNELLEKAFLMQKGVELCGFRGYLTSF